MTDLQLGLLVIGALAVAGVLLYNRIQERATRRAAQRAFASGHADVLLGGGARREPVLQPAARSDSGSDAPAGALPDSRIDYIVELGLQRPTGAAAVLEQWLPLERRFGTRALLAASDGRGWRQLKTADAAPCVSLRAALQLVSRSGVASDAELLEFRTEVESAGARLQAAVSAPEMREALEAAIALDRVCAEADIQVALHVLGSFGEQDLAPFHGQPFNLGRNDKGVTLTLDVPRTLDVARAYEAMARAAQHLAAGGGRLVDDNGRPLDERALGAIGTQLEPARRMLAEQGIEPGGTLALRLFS
jgi:ZipA-like protein with FtsZ-binding domain